MSTFFPVTKVNKLSRRMPVGSYNVGSYNVPHEDRVHWTRCS